MFGVVCLMHDQLADGELTKERPPHHARRKGRQCFPLLGVSLRFRTGRLLRGKKDIFLNHLALERYASRTLLKHPSHG
jgi:hypothetical protein